MKYQKALGDPATKSGKYVLTLTKEIGVNLACVDIILKLNDKIEELETIISTYKNKAQKVDNLSVVPDKKALVIQKSTLEMVIIKK